jgi:hypothetical protein
MDFTRRQDGHSEQVSDTTNLQMEYAIIKENVKVSAEKEFTANYIYESENVTTSALRRRRETASLSSYRMCHENMSPRDTQSVLINAE